ncbi:MAG: shikimate kinase [Bacteroidales bacterium]|nr:shikimate kinase [Bacteroidales bacterium]MCF8333631.1 shikimate kinase [Bacteroidales bacterium]
MYYPERIYLVGYMGSGKTTAGKQLASILDYEFRDLDHFIEETYKTSIPLLFKKYDEHAFRLIEQTMLHQTQAFKKTVIATGGGAPCFFDNMNFINRTGFSVYLKLPPAELLKRLVNTKRKRPIIENIENHELLEHITQKLETREPYYRMAQLIIEATNNTPEKIAEALRYQA